MKSHTGKVVAIVGKQRMVANMSSKSSKIFNQMCECVVGHACWNVCVLELGV